MHRIAVLGEERAFARVCGEDVSPAVKRLDELVGGNCATDLGEEWEEGVQASHVNGSTRIVVNRNVATVLDGPAPDRMVRFDGKWLLAEWPRNDRFRREWEACESAATINAILKTRHLPLIDAIAQLGCPARTGA